jgi:hypothetical protein
MEQAQQEVIVYGSLECGHTQTVLTQLEDLDVDYRYIDVPGNPEMMQRIAAWNGVTPHILLWISVETFWSRQHRCRWQLLCANMALHLDHLHSNSIASGDVSSYQEIEEAGLRHSQHLHAVARDA